MKKIDKALLIFIIIQPILDFYLLFSEKITGIFKFSPSTIIRIIFIVIFLLYVLIYKNHEKKHWWIIGYLSILLVYLIFHTINSLKFNNDISDTMIFSYLTEVLYIIRLMLPLFLIYIVYKLKISEDIFRKSIIIISLIFSFEIIITNVFKVSLTSYGGDNIISGNIFDWFLNNNYSFEELASKGFFYLANQISAVLIVLLPINIYYAIRFSNKWSYLSSFTLSLSMIMLGTRVSTYGWLIVATVLFLIWIIYSFIEKNKNKIPYKKFLLYFFTMVILLFITSNSPLIKRDTFVDYQKIEESMENRGKVDEIIETIDKEVDTKKKSDFVLEYSQYYSIPYIYINELYPYQKDPDFWIRTMKLPFYKRIGNRNLEKLITERVYELNNNKYDKYFGMGYSRFRNAKVYIENDFFVHFYTVGIFGILLFFLPYIIIPIYTVIYMLKYHNIRFKTTIICMSIYVCLGVSLFSGHVMDELIVTLILGYLSGYLLVFATKKREINISDLDQQIDDKKNNEKCLNPKISIIVPAYNVEKYINKCLNSLANQTLDEIEIIVIDDGSTDKTGKIIDDYTKNLNNFIVKHVTNGGVSKARNIGLSLARGEYIGFIDSDDYIESTMYEKMYNKALMNNYDIVACDVNIVYPDKIINIKSGIDDETINNDEKKKNILISSYAVIWNKIYKKSLLKNIMFREKCNFCEDVEFLYRVIPLANRIGSVNENFYNYIQNDGSLTYVYDKKLYQLIDVFDDLIKIYQNNKKYTNYKDEIEYSYVRYLYGTFLKRLAKTKNKNEYKKGLNIVIEKVNNNFPNYKKNKHIKKISLKNIYFKIFNKKVAMIVYYLQKNKKN